MGKREAGFGNKKQESQLPLLHNKPPEMFWLLKKSFILFMSLQWKQGSMQPAYLYTQH